MSTLDAVLALVASNAIILAGLGFLLQRWIDHRLTLALEEHRISLQAIADRELTRYSKLYEKRGEVLAEVYARLMGAIRAVDTFVQPIEWAGQPTRVENYRAAAGKILDFGEYFENHRIFLSSRTCGLVQALFETIKNPVHEFYAWDFPTEGQVAVAGRLRAVEEGREAMRSLVPGALEALEAEFRGVLGSND